MLEAGVIIPFCRGNSPKVHPVNLMVVALDLVKIKCEGVLYSALWVSVIGAGTGQGYNGAEKGRSQDLHPSRLS